MAGKIRAKDKDGLTELDRRVADEYLIDFNGARAGVAAGLEPKTAAKSAWRILKKVAVKAYLQRKIKERSERTQITQDDVIQEFRKMAFNPDFSESTRLRALENLGKHLGLYDQTRPLPEPIDQDISEMSDDEVDREYRRLLEELGTEGQASKDQPAQTGKGAARGSRAPRNLRPN